MRWCLAMPLQLCWPCSPHCRPSSLLLPAHHGIVPSSRATLACQTILLGGYKAGDCTHPTACPRQLPTLVCDAASRTCLEPLEAVCAAQRFDVGACSCLMRKGRNTGRIFARVIHAGGPTPEPNPHGVLLNVDGVKIHILSQHNGLPRARMPWGQLHAVPCNCLGARSHCSPRGSAGRDQREMEREHSSLSGTLRRPQKGDHAAGPCT